MRTLASGIAMTYLGEYNYDWGRVMAAAVGAAVPILVIFIFLQKVYDCRSDGRCGERIGRQFMKQRQNIVFSFPTSSGRIRWAATASRFPYRPGWISSACGDAVNLPMLYAPASLRTGHRAMLQTGLYPTQTGCYRNAVSCRPARRRAKYLREAGYRVAYGEMASGIR